MAKQVFSYYGLSLEELEKKSLKELAQLMPSRIKRSLKRGLTEQQKILLKKVESAKQILKEGKQVKPIKTHCRNMPILPVMVGLKIGVHNGKTFEVIEIAPEMIGNYLGEFSLTRKRVQHSAPGVGATKSSLFVPVK